MKLSSENNSNSTKRVALISAGALLILGLGIAGYQSLYLNRTVAVVGDYKVPFKGKKYRDQVQRIFYPNDPQSYGKDQLVRAYTYAQILKNNGLEITEAMIRAEEMRIQQNTKDPQTLAKIQKLFKGDEEAYKKYFILPTLSERLIYYEFFNKSPKAQAKSLARVQSFLKHLEDPKASFAAAAEKDNLKVRQLTLSKAGGLQWSEADAQEANEGSLKKKAKQPAQKVPDVSTVPANIKQKMDEQALVQSNEAVQFWIEQIVPRLKAGEVLKEPVDYQENWLVVKYLKALPKGAYQFQAVFIPKDNYNEWLEAEKAKVKIQ